MYHVAVGAYQAKSCFSNAPYHSQSDIRFGSKKTLTIQSTGAQNDIAADAGLDVVVNATVCGSISIIITLQMLDYCVCIAE